MAAVKDEMAVGPPRFSYGTAGFRAEASKLLAIIPRMATVMSRFASESSPGAVGIVFTASHNPVHDNGIKMVASDGAMASERWEMLAEDMVNASDSSDDDADIGFDMAGTIIMGRDTRPSGSRFFSVFANELLRRYPGVRLVDVGLVTTPLLHYMVKAFNSGRYSSTDQIKAEYYRSTVEPLLLDSDGCCGTQVPVILDCANGVGATMMRELLASIHHPLLLDSITLINCGEGVLNDACGADYVKMTGSPPANSNACSSGFLGASFDGDADRLVMWTASDGLNVLDGDKIAALLAVFLKERVGMRTAVVQTAYANGAATDFLRQRGIEVSRTFTGVKHLHRQAHRLLAEFDAVVYFEANGHGTVLFSARSTEKQLPFMKMVNECTGDALSDLFLVLYVLKEMRWSVADWMGLYVDRPSVQLKVSVPDKLWFRCAEDSEETLVRPESIQSEIDKAVRLFGDGARAFVRASGTENCVRVYAEGGCSEDARALGAQVKEILAQNCR